MPERFRGGCSFGGPSTWLVDGRSPAVTIGARHSIDGRPHRRPGQQACSLGATASPVWPGGYSRPGTMAGMDDDAAWLARVVSKATAARSFSMILARMASRERSNTARLPATNSREPRRLRR